jgi:hypothetical protein
MAHYVTDFHRVASIQNRCGFAASPWRLRGNARLPGSPRRIESPTGPGNAGSGKFVPVAHADPLTGATISNAVLPQPCVAETQSIRRALCAKAQTPIARKRTAPGVSLLRRGTQL